MSDVVVVGAGLAGLVASIRLAEAGAKVTLVSKGIGGIQLGQGTVDVLGYAPELVTDPIGQLDDFVARNPSHPYATIGATNVQAGVGYLAGLVPHLLSGDLTKNRLLPTAVGALRPTLLAQPSMTAGELAAGGKYVFIGLHQLKDFWPELIAGNVVRSPAAPGAVEARADWIDLPARTGEADSTPLAYARSMDNQAFRSEFVSAIKGVIEPFELVGLPAVLGYQAPGVTQEIADELGTAVFEISTIPPSIPGMRLNDALTKRAKSARVRMVLGSPVVGVETAGHRVTGVQARTTGHDTTYACDHVVYAPGGFESGALLLDSYMRLSEPALGLPVERPDGDLILPDHSVDHPLFRAGIRTDSRLRPITESGDVVYENLYAAGGILAGATRWSEKSGDGIALGSAIAATNAILGSDK